GWLLPRTGSRPAGGQTIRHKWRLPRLRSTGREMAVNSGTGVDVFVAQVPRHERDRDGKRAGGLGQVRDQRSRPFLAGAGGQDQDADVGVLVDQFQDFFGGVAFADHAVRSDARDLLCARRIFVEGRVRRLLRFRLHQVGDAEPLLIAVARLDHAKHHDLRLGAAGALCRPVDGAVALLGVVDDDQVLALVPGFVAAPLAAHGRDAPARSYAL